MFNIINSLSFDAFQEKAFTFNVKSDSMLIIQLYSTLFLSPSQLEERGTRPKSGQWVESNYNPMFYNPLNRF